MIALLSTLLPYPVLPSRCVLPPPSPWANTRLYRSPPSPSPFPLDGEDHTATETIPEITLEDRQAQRCCQNRNSLVSCLDADARLFREKTLRRERQAQALDLLLHKWDISGKVKIRSL